MGNTAASKLPEQFSELNNYVEKWDNPGIAEQYAERLGSTIEELQDFHDIVKPRVQEIRDYLDSKQFADYTEEDRILGRLVFAWVTVAEAVEVFKQVKVPDSKMYWEIVEEPHQF